MLQHVVTGKRPTPNDPAFCTMDTPEATDRWLVEFPTMARHVFLPHSRAQSKDGDDFMRRIRNRRGGFKYSNAEPINNIEMADNIGNDHNTK
jgi:hypothetical protein